MSAQPALVTDDGTRGIIQVIPTTAPARQATKDLIAHLRQPDTAKDVDAPHTLR